MTDETSKQCKHVCECERIESKCGIKSSFKKKLLFILTSQIL